MTLGKKLSNYRTIHDLTQQQLGDKLNVSAQAVSKWENDLATPDILTLKRLSELYHVTLDELVDLNSGFSVPEDEEAENEPEIKIPIGFCKRCGITVTEENLGEKSPIILCNSCVALRDNEIKEAAEERERKAKEDAATRIREAQEREKAAKIKLECDRDVIRRKRNISFIFAAIAAIAVLAFMISWMSDGFDIGKLVFSIFLTYAVFAFVSSMFFESTVHDVVENMLGFSINWPGLIFTFDLDGFIWLIGMKILFAVLGFLAGALVGLLGIVLGLLIAPFIYPFTLIKISRDIVKGDTSDY